MIGSSHEIDTSFMDEIPQESQDAALDVIRNSSLKEMLEIRLNGPSEFLANKFSLSELEWKFLMDRVILTKISYFDLQLHFPNRYIDKLIEIGCFCYGMDKADAVGFYQTLLKTHPSFAAWVKKAIQTKQMNIRYEQQRNSQSA